MKIIPLIWLIFTVIFACFGVYHLAQLKHPYKHFEWEALTSHGVDSDFFSPSAIETRYNVKKFIRQWNQYIDQQNKISYYINFIAAIGYLCASFMALIAMILPGPYNIKNTTNYLHEKCANSNLYKIYIRQIKPHTKDSKNHENHKPEGPD